MKFLWWFLIHNLGSEIVWTSFFVWQQDFFTQQSCTLSLRSCSSTSIIVSLRQVYPPVWASQILFSIYVSVGEKSKLFFFLTWVLRWMANCIVCCVWDNGRTGNWGWDVWAIIFKLPWGRERFEAISVNTDYLLSK